MALGSAPSTIRSQAAKQMLDAAAAAKKAKIGVYMNEQLAPIGDMITLIANEQPGEASSVLNDLLSARVSDALQAYKQEIAQSLFAPSADTLSEGSYELPDGSQTRSGVEADAAWKKHHLENPKSKKSQFHKIHKKTVKEEIVQEEHESVEDFKKRGGTVKQIPAHKSYSAPKAQKIKVPFRMGKSAMREESEQLDEMSTRKHFQQVADIIKAHPDAAKRKELAAHHAGIFKAQNPRFDHHRFYAAANAGEPGV